MTKIALICDTHYGCRNDARPYLDNQVKFFEKIFFPYIDKEDIKTVIHLGDVTDRRKYINFNTYNTLTNSLIKPLCDRGIMSHWIVGNHDTFYKDTNEINSMKEMYGESAYSELMRLYENPEMVNIEGLDILMVPWICKANEEMTLDLIKNTKANVAMGHLELFGFEMYKGSFADHGMDHKSFANFDMVFSGHYHHKSSTGNIHYLGSTAQYTWGDYGDTRGFHIFDTQTRELTFISNHYNMFNKYVYDDVSKTPDQMLNFDASVFTGTNVKIVVKNKNDPYLLEKVIDKFNKCDILNLQVIEDVLQLGFENSEDVVDETEDTLTILKKYVEMTTYGDKPSLEKFITTLYNEALELGN